MKQGLVSLAILLVLAMAPVVSAQTFQDMDGLLSYVWHPVPTTYGDTLARVEVQLYVNGVMDTAFSVPAPDTLIHHFHQLPAEGATGYLRLRSVSTIPGNVSEWVQSGNVVWNSGTNILPPVLGGWLED